jgi:hypothetical protein
VLYHPALPRTVAQGTTCQAPATKGHVPRGRNDVDCTPSSRPSTVLDWRPREIGSSPYPRPARWSGGGGGVGRGGDRSSFPIRKGRVRAKRRLHIPTTLWWGGCCGLVVEASSPVSSAEYTLDTYFHHSWVSLVYIPDRLPPAKLFI